MFNKTLISEFFTTIDWSIFLNTLSLLTYKLYFLRYWNSNNILKNQLWVYLWAWDSKIVNFYNWRSALYHCLKHIKVKKTDEIIVSAYTCVSVSNAVIQSSWKIVYSDIESKNLWFDIKKLESSITKNTKVILVQHSFWKNWNIKEVIKLAKKYNIIVIEDCAHSLWSEIDWKKLWTFWDFAIFSTWRDKVISSVTGWFLLINNKKYFNWIDKIEKKLKITSISLTIKNLNYNIFAYLALKTYNFLSIWKVIISLSRKFSLITEILTKSEKNCNFKDFNYKLANSLAFLATKELENIKLYNLHRNTIAEYYNNSINNKKIKVIFKNKKNEYNNYFRYPILLKDTKTKEELYLYMKKNNILLWNTWSWINIVPFGTNIKKSLYKWNSELAEDISSRILTLPNHNWINEKDSQKIVELLNKF